MAYLGHGRDTPRHYSRNGPLKMSKVTSKTAIALLALALVVFAPSSAHTPIELRADNLGEALVLCGSLPSHQISACDSAAFRSFVPATEGK